MLGLAAVEGTCLQSDERREGARKPARLTLASQVGFRRLRVSQVASHFSWLPFEFEGFLFLKPDFLFEEITYLLWCQCISVLRVQEKTLTPFFLPNSVSFHVIGSHSAWVGGRNLYFFNKSINIQLQIMIFGGGIKLILNHSLRHSNFLLLL